MPAVLEEPKTSLCNLTLVVRWHMFQNRQHSDHIKGWQFREVSRKPALDKQCRANLPRGGEVRINPNVFGQVRHRAGKRLCTTANVQKAATGAQKRPCFSDAPPSEKAIQCGHTLT